jgi:hypothetical protein
MDSEKCVENQGNESRLISKVTHGLKYKDDMLSCVA